MRISALILILGISLAPACGVDPEGDDGGTEDAGAVDAGGTDGGGSDGGATDGGGATALTFSQVEIQILSGCTGSQCHATGNPSGNVALDVLDTHAALVGVASTEVPTMSYIEPGFPAESYLYRKLEGTHEQACSDAGLMVQQCGAQMPRLRPAISATLLEGLRLWIEEGANVN